MFSNLRTLRCVFYFILAVFLLSLINPIYSGVDIEEEVEIKQTFGNVDGKIMSTTPQVFDFSKARGQELKQKRTRNSKFYSIDSTKVKQLYFPMPIHYRGTKGNWKNVEPILVKTQKRTKYRYKYIHSYFKLYLKQNISKKRGIKLKTGEKCFYFSFPELVYISNDSYQTFNNLELEFKEIKNGNIIFKDSNSKFSLQFSYSIKGITAKINFNRNSNKDLFLKSSIKCLDSLRSKINIQRIKNGIQNTSRNSAHTNINQLITILYSNDNRLNSDNNIANIFYHSLNNSNTNKITILFSGSYSVFHQKNNDLAKKMLSNENLSQVVPDGAKIGKIYLNLPNKKIIIDSSSKVSYNRDNKLQKKASNAKIIKSNKEISENSRDFSKLANLSYGYYSISLFDWSDDMEEVNILYPGYNDTLFINQHGIPQKWYITTYAESTFGNTTMYMDFKINVKGYNDGKKDTVIVDTSRINPAGHPAGRDYYWHVSLGPDSVAEKCDSARAHIYFSATTDDDWRTLKITNTVPIIMQKLKITKPEMATDTIYYIDNTPSMPTIDCKIKKSSFLEGKNIDWNCDIEYDFQVTDENGNTADFDRHQGSATIETTKGYEESKQGFSWDLSSHDPIGGEAKISASTTVDGEEYTDTTTIYIRGENPDSSEVLTGLDAGESAMIQTEAPNYNQFDTETYVNWGDYSDKPEDNLPLCSDADSTGWGLCQLDESVYSINTSTLWNWRENKEEGTDEFDRIQSLMDDSLEARGDFITQPDGETRQSMIDAEAYSQYNGGPDASYWFWDGRDNEWAEGATNPTDDEFEPGSADDGQENVNHYQRNY